MFSDDDMLMLSGIQHYRFCPRQWALIHIEQQWGDNRLTMEGSLLHKHVDDPFYRQKCGDHITLRSVSIASHELGLYGISDAIELHPTDDAVNSITHPRYPGRWQPYPIEYKHGKPKRNEVDEVQLAAQAMCLEEQYGIRVAYGAFFYAEIRHRVEVWSSIVPSRCTKYFLLAHCLPFSGAGTARNALYVICVCLSRPTVPKCLTI